MRTIYWQNVVCLTEIEINEQKNRISKVTGRGEIEMTIRKEIWKIMSDNKAALIIYLFVSCVLSFSGPFSLYAQSYFIDNIESMAGTEFAAINFVYPVVLLFLSFLLPMLSFVTNILLMKFDHICDLGWNKKINDLVKNIPYYKYEQEDTYDKIKQIGEGNIYSASILSVFLVFSLVMNIIFYMFILVRISIWLTLSVLVFAPLIGYLSFKIADKQYKKIYKMNPDRRRGIYKSSILRSQEYAKEIRLNRCSDYMVDDWIETQKSIDAKVLKVKFKYGFLSALIEKTEYIVILVNLIIVLLSYVNGIITIGVFISISNQIFSMRILSRIQGIVSRITTIKSMKDVYSEVLELTQGSRKRYDDIHMAPPVIVEFRNVSFKYPQQEEFILNHINLRFKANESVAVVGENGAGKSTLIKLMLGLYEPVEGEVFVNGINLKDLSLPEKSKIFGAVFQDYAKFGLSLRENITLGEDEDEKDFAQKAQYFKIDEIADSLRNGYATLLGKSFGNAVDLSGGQWQQMAITRALVGERKILIFDEPTALLDPVQEVDMFEKIYTVTKNKISVFVTHRLGFTSKVDRIILIKENQVIEDGHFNELMNKNGEFKKMFEKQKSLYEKGNII